VHVLLAGRSELVDWGRRRILSAWPGAAEGAESIERLRDAEVGAVRTTERRSRLAARLLQLPASSRMIVDPEVGCAWIFAEPGTSGPVRKAEPSSAAAALSGRLKRAFDPDGILAAI
jgi:hypothetical protein